MNINETIVRLLKDGNNVDINGLGTFSTTLEPAHHDQSTGTFYPDQLRVVFLQGNAKPDAESNTLVIEDIAKNECVDNNIATLMWKNIVDAIIQKLNKDGVWDIEGLGTLVRCADGYAFNANTISNFGNESLQPIKNVTTYDTPSNEDPFAVFDQPFQQDPQPESQEVSNAEDTPQSDNSAPDMAVATDINADNTPDSQQAPTDESDATTTNNQEEQVEQAQLSEQDVVAENPMLQQPETEVSDSLDESSTDNEAMSSNIATDIDETLDTLDSIPTSTPTDNKRKKGKHTGLWILIAVILLLCGAFAYFYFAYCPNHGGNINSGFASLKNSVASIIRGEGSEIAEPETADSIDAEELTESVLATDNTDNESTSAETELEDIESLTNTTPDEVETVAEATTEISTEADNPNTEEVAQLSAETSEPQEEVTEIKNTSQLESEEAPNNEFYVADYCLMFTTNTDLIDFEPSDIQRDVRKVNKNLAEYIGRFLAARNYTNAQSLFISRIDKYAQMRFAELYNTDTFSVARLFPDDNDYVRDYLYDGLKKRKEHQSIIAVQSELMDYAMLDEMLKTMINELSIQPDAPKPAPVDPAAAYRTKPITFTQAAKPIATFAKKSKQGFDVIAGFYTNQNSANRMASILKRQGCDAYIIDKQGLYYVSMGSAPSQTAAEALYKHIKSWYDGDIVIRKL
ncbi:MAG: SPOR domain-containing protein [Bacteroidales bacterium]|nr:SPOR domain-containing protein [Candidatus Colimorpha onthohippi]